MFRRGKRSWRTAALVGLLLFAAGPGRAMAWQGPDPRLTGWESAWEWIASWFGHRAAATPAMSGSTADRGAREKSSSQIDPNGLTAPGSSVQSDSSAGIDPDGKH